MKYFGCIFLFLGFSFFSREYLQGRKRKSEVCIALLSFLQHLEKALSLSVASPSRAISDFKSDILSECGFLKKIGENKSIATALESVFAFFRFSDEDKQKLANVFSKLNSSDYRDMCRRVSEAKEEMRLFLKKEEEDTARALKIVPTLTAAFAVGFAILVI